MFNVKLTFTRIIMRFDYLDGFRVFFVCRFLINIALGGALWTSHWWEISVLDDKLSHAQDILRILRDLETSWYEMDDMMAQKSI